MFDYRLLFQCHLGMGVVEILKINMIRNRPISLKDARFLLSSSAEKIEHRYFY
jgi:hypothetical protein